MGKKSLFTPVLGLIILCFGLNTATAQLNKAGNILRAGKDDSNTLLGEYLKPLGKGFGTNMNSGWFSTAKTHSTLGFDITVNASVAMVPDTDLLFDANSLNYTTIQYIDNGRGSLSPTAFGENETGATMGAYYQNPATGNEELLFSFDMPQGVGEPYVPAPMLQASVGIIKDTDITVRFLPPLNLPNEAELGLFGLGVKHGLNQWLPAGNLLPVDLSVQAGYTSLKSSLAFDVQPDEGSDIQNDYPASTWDGQKVEYTTKAFTANALVGKTLPILSLWAGVGYQSSNVNMGTPGSYPVTVINDEYDPDTNNRSRKIDKVDHPIDLTYDNSTSFHAIVGTRIKLAIFNISASYTLSEYPVLQAGFGIGIR